MAKKSEAKSALSVGIADAQGNVDCEAALAAFKAEVSDKASDADPANEHDWRGLTVGWAIAKGMSPRTPTASPSTSDIGPISPGAAGERRQSDGAQGRGGRWRR